MGQMSDFLASMVSESLARAEAARSASRESDLRASAASIPPPLSLSLAEPGFDLIAEPKLASPSEGPLASTESPAELADSMVDAGAAVLSVLTEPTVFRGHLSHLEEVASSAPVPVMRKDFLVDPIQVLEARAAGASGLLLIAKALDGGRLEEMTDLAIELGMFVLVEVFDEADLDVASSVLDRPVLIGVNARDLVTLQVDPGKHARMRPLLPDGIPAVAESGLLTAADAARSAALGYRLALVGSALVSSGDAAQLVDAMLVAGRGAASEQDR